MINIVHETFLVIFFSRSKKNQFEVKLKQQKNKERLRNSEVASEANRAIMAYFKTKRCLLHPPVRVGAMVTRLMHWRHCKICSNPPQLFLFSFISFYFVYPCYKKTISAGATQSITRITLYSCFTHSGLPAIKIIYNKIPPHAPSATIMSWYLSSA